MESIEILKRKIKREKAARLEAERLLEEKSRELYDKGQMLEERSLQLFAEGQKLEKLNSTLETRVAAGMLKLQRSNAMLTTLHETVLMAAEVDTFDEALERCLNAICHLSGWPLGHIYKRVNDGEDSLLSSGIWYLEKPDLFKGFREVTALTKYKRGLGLPGRIWETGAPVWIDDVSRDDNFLRATTGVGLEVRCGFGFPVKIKGHLAAVLELFNDEICERDEPLLTLLGSVGEQVGRVLERQEALREQRVAREDADRANNAKSRFLANMSHEIRTPMNAILGLTELLLDGDVTDMQREYLSTVLASGEGLLVLVNDILDLSKIEADAVTLERTVVNLHEIVFSVMRSMATQAHIKDLELLCSIDADVPEFISGDKVRIQQILINLIGNAIKFTQHGEVELRLECFEDDAHGRGLRFLICDTGIGIAKEKQDSIFSEFEQADASTTRQFGGTGLGLSIVSRLVGLMGGAIEIDSSIGVGSSIGFTIGESCYAIPPNMAQDGHDTQISIYELGDSDRRASLEGCSIMLVDGSLGHQELFGEWIHRFGGTVCTTCTLSEALEKLHESGGRAKNVDFVFVDAHVMVDSGSKSLQELMAQLSETTRLMVMHDSTTQLQKANLCQQVELAHEFLKPLNYAEVLSVIYKLYGLEKDHGMLDEGAVEVGLKAPRSLRVLVAEDSVVNQKLAVAMLHKLGHEVVLANHGKEALAAIEVQEFDVVLMDIQMPEMDGFETVRRLRNSEIDGRIPVIALTANAMRGDRDACMEAGMDSYLSKPIRLQKLADVINEVCRNE